MSLLAGYSRYATDDWWISSRRLWRLPLTLLLLALVGGLGWDFARRGQEQLHLVRAERSRLASEEQLTELRAAFAIEPQNAWTAHDIGELFRLRAYTGAEGYTEFATEACAWFDRAARLNPFEPAFPIGAGRALDRISSAPTKPANVFNGRSKSTPTVASRASTWAGTNCRKAMRPPPTSGS